MKLSILICTLEERAAQLQHLLQRLYPQIMPDVEVLTEIDNGDMTVGEKRNRLLERADGDYVCFVDDDDDVSDRYVEGILHAVETNPDCVAVHGDYITPTGSRPMVMTRSGRRTGLPRNCYRRTCGHLNPVRRWSALATKFALMSSGEDSDYSAHLARHLKTEAVADPELTRYKYLYDLVKSATYHARNGFAYSNRFGGDFAFAMDVRCLGGPLRLKITDAVVSTDAMHAGMRVQLAVQRTGLLATVSVDDRKQCDAWLGSATSNVTVSLLADSLQLLRPGPCVVNGRRVILCYARKVA